MKTLIATLLLALSAQAFTQIIQHDDLLQKDLLILNLDGLEIWDVPQSERVQRLEAFTNKCQNEISLRNATHAEELAMSHDFFHPNDLVTKYEVIKNRTSYGDQYFCRGTISIKAKSPFYFSFKYSEIYSDPNGTEELCRMKISEIDQTAIENRVYTRRAYFVYAQDRRGNPYFPKCQTLKVILTPNNL